MEEVDSLVPASGRVDCHQAQVVVGNSHVTKSHQLFLSLALAWGSESYARFTTH